MINLVRAIWHRSLENPQTSLSDPDAWLWDAFGAGKSSAGVNVNRRSALSYPAVWRAVNLVSRIVAKTPLLVWERLPEGGKNRDRKHAAFPLLHRLAAPNVTAFVFRQTLLGHMLLNGNGYAFIHRRGDGGPQELLILNPEETYPVRENGKLWYVTTVKGELRKLFPRNVLHVHGLGFDGTMGYAVITLARESFGLGLAMAGYSSRYFRSNASPGVVLEHPGHLTSEARNKIRQDWDRMHSGLDQSHRTSVLIEGMKANPFTMSARDSQFAETWQKEIRDVANWFGVPPHMLGDPTATPYASREMADQEILDEADGLLVAMEQECTEKLMTEEQKANDTHFCEFLRAAFARADMKTRSAGLVNYVNAGIMKVNEARAIENMNPVEGGDDLRQPLNMGLVGDNDDDDGAASKPKPKPATKAKQDDNDDDRAVVFAPSPELLKAHRGLVVDAARRIGKRIALHARKAAKKPDGFGDWVDRMEGEHLEVFVDMLSHAVLAIRCVAGGAASWTANDLATHYFGEIREELLTASECQPGELGGKITECTRGLEDIWPERLADELMDHNAAEAAVTS